MGEDDGLAIVFWGPPLLALIAGIVYPLLKWTWQPQATVDWKKAQYWGCLPAVLLFITIIFFAFLSGSGVLFLIAPFTAFAVYVLWNFGMAFGAGVTKFGRVPLTFVRERGGIGITVVLGIIGAFILMVLVFIGGLLENALNEWLGGSGALPLGL